MNIGTMKTFEISIIVCIQLCINLQNVQNITDFTFEYYNVN
jgi:hypothetical protein